MTVPTLWKWLAVAIAVVVVGGAYRWTVREYEAQQRELAARNHEGELSFQRRTRDGLARDEAAAASTNSPCAEFIGCCQALEEWNHTRLPADLDVQKIMVINQCCHGGDINVFPRCSNVVVSMQMRNSAPETECRAAFAEMQLALPPSTSPAACGDVAGRRAEAAARRAAEEANSTPVDVNNYGVWIEAIRLRDNPNGTVDVRLLTSGSTRTVAASEVRVPFPPGTHVRVRRGTQRCDEASWSESRGSILERLSNGHYRVRLDVRPRGVSAAIIADDIDAGRMDNNGYSINEYRPMEVCPIDNSARRR